MFRFEQVSAGSTGSYGTELNVQRIQMTQEF